MVPGSSRPLRVAVVHNLKPGGARRRMTAQVERLDADVTEFCLGTASTYSERPQVERFAPRALAHRR